MVEFSFHKPTDEKMKNSVTEQVRRGSEMELPYFHWSEGRKLDISAAEVLSTLQSVSLVFIMDCYYG